MGLRFRKSFKIAPGVRLNVGKKSAGLSFGVNGLRHSINSSGRRMSSVGIPGTGLSYVTTKSGKPYKSKAYQTHKNLQAQQKQLLKEQEKEQAQYEVELFENQCELVKSIHIECDDNVDWMSILNTSPPYQLGEPGPKEREAQYQYDHYKPGFFERVFNKDEEQYALLSEQIQQAKVEDEKAYKEWEELIELAKSVQTGDIDTYFKVIEEMDPLGDLSEFGSGFELSTDAPSYMEVEFDVHSNHIIPTEEKKLTKTGKLSVRQMTKTRYYGLLQNYVCSCILRIARDLFALLPLQTVVIHAFDEQLNTATGHEERLLILSVKIDRDILEGLNFENIDCSDSMNNFPHHMKFRKTKGFDLVEKIKANN
ncbi:DUF4236 domain-containing protein [Bacillus sp. V3B]|uniref:DUF4236 domain-containing protein n=1 Tax=Bacillus sp. V3B TaxID=2804915 RepID=UPI002109525C|nr:DUF4236 domain-containing protein [Bacillus sp. V3B]MCQ6276231.1 DUF4236 domain-containing protein [Bacillus sp. V3B]